MLSVNRVGKRDVRTTKNYSTRCFFLCGGIALAPAVALRAYVLGEEAGPD